MTNFPSQPVASAKREYAIFVAILCVLTAMGVPALQRGSAIEGWICIALAAVVAIYGVITIRPGRK